MTMRSGSYLVCALAACSYEPRALETDAPDVDATAVADTPVDGAPVWTVIETLTIDSANAVATPSLTSLAAGVVYHLRASGEITNVIDAFEGDADYYDFQNPKDQGCCEDIGLGIDDTVVDDHDTKPDWGPFRPNHVYEVEWTGEGRPITALFQDTFYGNNIGNLTLEILELR